jgi:hypothetical protein
LLTVTVRLPWATAQFCSVTRWFITTEPVRELTMTLAACCAGVTSRFSRWPRKATRALESSGARTWMLRPSSALAVPGGRG